MTRHNVHFTYSILSFSTEIFSSKNTTINACEYTKSSSVQSFDNHLISNPSFLDPYVCPLCGKSYQSRTGLKFHLDVHHNDKQVGCPLCSKTFSRQFCMTRHLRMVHNMKICPLCNCPFELSHINAHILSCTSPKM